MKKLLLGSAAILTLAAGSAIAADMPVKAPIIPAVIYDWTGFFLGGGVSGSWGRVRDSGTYRPSFYDSSQGGAAAVSPSGAVPTTRPINHTIRGWDAEIQGGYRRQFGTFVAGLEGIVRWTNERGTGTCYETYPTGYPVTSGAATTGNAPGTFSCYKRTRLNSTETLLLQLGVLASPALLLSVSGGPALGQIRTNDAFVWIYTTNATMSGSSSATTNKGGYWLGASAEYALPRSPWHIKLEYAYMNFGNVNTTTTWIDTNTLCNSTRSPTGCVNTFTNGRRVSDNAVLLGLNYAFGAPVAAPISTRY
jgi:outer membrane immunogenic protein